MPTNPVLDGFEQMLSRYLMTTDQAVELVLTVAAARDPERYTDAVELVKTGRLIPRVVSQPGTLTISLIDTQSGKSIGKIFHYSLPALEARGVLN